MRLHTKPGRRKIGPANRLATVLLPGRLRRRARAAASLPTWLAGIFAALAIPLSVEMIAYAVGVVQSFSGVMFSQWQRSAGLPRDAAWVLLEVAARQVRPRVIPAALQDSLPALIGALIVLLVIALLESLNVVLLAPLAAAGGQPLSRVRPRSRRVLLSLGSVWLIEATAVWLILLLGIGGAALHLAGVSRMVLTYEILHNILVLSLSIGVPLIVLVWLARMMWACSRLTRPTRGPLPARCTRCGYRMEGLPADHHCPDCGQVRPAEADALREPSPWARRGQIGWRRAYTQTCRGVLLHPRRFFGRLQVIGEPHDALRFLLVNVLLGMPVWLLAMPGIAAAITQPTDIALAGNFAVAACWAIAMAVAAALVGLLLVGLLISLTGFAIVQAREEPCWPIAVQAGCHLAALLPRIFAAQALWVTGAFTIDHLVGRDAIERIILRASLATFIPWEVVLGVAFALPTLAGLAWLLLVARESLRGVQYACR